MRNLLSRSLIALAAITLMATLFVVSWDRYVSIVVAQGPLPACVAPPAGMVGWWPSDGNANDIQGGNNGTLQNGATFAAGKVGQGFFFDGADDSVQVPHNANLDPGTGSFTIDAWVKTTKATGSQTIVSKYECGQACPPGVANSIYFVTIRDGKLEVTLRDTDASAPGIQILDGVTFLSDGNFHHVVMIRDIAAGQLRLYVDGLLDASAALNAAADGPIKDDDGEPDPFLIGARFAGGTTSKTEFFSGIIDEVEFFNRALATSEIQAIVNAGSVGKCRTCTPPPSGMASWWPGDGNANDIQGSNNATLLNGAIFAAGMVGQGFKFDGVNDYVDVPTSSGSPLSTWTIDFWFFLNSNTTSQAFVTNFDGSGSRYIIEYHATLGLRLGHFATFPDLNSSVKPSAGVWHHLTAIQSTNPGVGQSLYLDGNLIGTAGANIADPTIHLKFGQRGDGTFFLNGLLDEIEVFNRALSASEIQAIVNAGSAGKCKNHLPVAACQNVTVSAGASCMASASIDNDSSDPDGDAITLTQSPAGPYPLGNTSVTLTVTDSKGASSTCSATVTVVDTTLPIINPPANASYQCASQVPPGNPSQATATDNCSTPTIAMADASNGGAGSTASPLVITRVFTATDTAGNSANAYQTITVIDNTPPTITAPPAMNASTGAGAMACGTVVSDAALGTATASDNCGGAGVTRSGVPSGNFFPVGTTTISYTANDGQGNTATATQTVTVVDNTPPAIGCPANIIKPTDPGQCSAVVNFTITAMDNCPGATVVSNPPSGSVFPQGTTTVTSTATDAAGNTAVCTFTVTVNDTESPTVSCPAGTTVSANASCQAAVPNVLGGVTAADNCTPAGSLIKTQSPAAGTLVGLGTTTITVMVADAAGNSSACTTTVTVVDTTPPTITVCAAPQSANANASCQAAVPDFTGGVTATDNCSVSGSLTVTQSPAAGTSVGLGVTPVTITVRDAAGNTVTCPTSFTVTDHTNPVIGSYPSPITVYTGAGATSCSATASWIPPTASDNCGIPTLTSSHNPGATFPVGTTTVSYTATDGAGNQATCSFTVTVVDNTPPVIACPANVSAFCSATVNPGVATATDNCPGVTVTGTRSDGKALNSPYPLGTTTITWRARDAAGNTASCVQTVAVTNPAPVATITGPPTGSVYPVNTTVNFTGSFTDDPGSTHTATWTFDNLTSAGTVNEMTDVVTGSYTFTEAGVYKVTLTVTDNCGGAGSANTIDELDLLVVVYDPNGGWVTGGGWINSPAGAYVANPSLTGKANFGFVSKYQNGATIPTGNTEFQFKAGNLNFSSTSYDWLVVAGARAQYKGSGKINNAGDYRFMLTAIDGDQPGGGQDKFRIRIWNNMGGGMVYDNQMNADDNDDPTTLLGGGSIVIHK